MNWLGVSRKNSIAVQLIQAVFAVYCLIAVIVTGIHIAVEYRHTQKAIYNELAFNEKIFGLVLAQGLWDLDKQQIQGVLRGMLTVPTIVGVKVEQQGAIVSAIGRVQSDSNQVIEYSSTGELNDKSSEQAGNLFSVEFPIVYSYRDQRKSIGKATVYSDSGAVIDRISVGFIMLIINAIIKTIALWIIFIWLGKKLLVKPLTKLTDAIERVNFNSLDTFKLNLDLPWSNELSVIENKFSIMVAELELSKKELLDFNRQLESCVEGRTQDLVESKEVAEKASGAKTVFLSRMSHELRTPLNAIIGFSNRQKKLLEKGDVDTEKILTMAGYINKSGYHLLMLITDIMSYVESEQGKIKVNLESCALQDIVSDCFHMAESLAEQHNISLLSEVEPCDVLADPGRLRQICINLIANGIKYNQTNGSVTLVSRVTCDRVEIDFIDTGIGIAAADQEKIFKPFARLEYAEDNAIEGSGIGLALSQFLMKKMGGDIQVCSELGDGATFTVSLPLAKECIKS